MRRPRDERELEYQNYIFDHRENVKKMYNKYKDVFLSVFICGDITSQIEKHDTSKYSVEEFTPYRKTFYPADNDTPLKKDEFTLAWLHHIHNNPHHPEYWVLYDASANNNMHILEMPDNYIIEMVCDWLAMGITSGMPAHDWYELNKESIPFTNLVRSKVELTLEYIAEFDKKLFENGKIST